MSAKKPTNQPDNSPANGDCRPAPCSRFAVIRDEDACNHAIAIAENGKWIIHLNRGTERNEENIERIVEILNANAGGMASGADGSPLPAKEKP
jgi:hypothetical protein